MKYFNIFYLFVIIAGLGLWRLNVSLGTGVVSFFGFAENKETEINFNYSVAVGKIYVSPGQFVKKGEPLLEMHRIKSKETLEDQPFRIAELKAKERAWKSGKAGDIKLTSSKQRLRLEEIDANILELKQEQKFQSSLYDDLKSVEKKEAKYSPIDTKIRELERERVLIVEAQAQEIQNIQTEIKIGASPYREEIKRLEAEQAFEEANEKIDIQLIAPADGVIGNIYCKEAEHIPSYKTLVSFYEPNPSLVKGFIQEDLILHVTVNDSFLIRSTKDEAIACYGVVTGLGSRIVEIPERLRKIPEMKTYGRELLISIPKKNNFLQKEKVILEFLNAPEGVNNRPTRKPVVDLKDVR